MTSYVTVTDLFCGAGGSSDGARRAARGDRGVQVQLAINHWRKAVDTHAANFRDTEHDCADVSQLHPSRYRRTTILVASPECFPAGTLILTQRGLIPIEEIVVGDQVLTHRGRWRSVTSVMCRTASTILVKGHGHPGLEVTEEHPFFVRRQRQGRNKSGQGSGRIMDDPEWVAASQLLCGTYRWATPVVADTLPIPEVGGRGADFSESFWWMVGRWLGDGVLRIRDTDERPPKRPKRPHPQYPSDCEVCGRPVQPLRRYAHLAMFYCSKACKDRASARHSGWKGSSVQICCGYHEAEELAARLNFAPPQGARSVRGEYRWSRREMRTAVLFDCPHNGLASWLLEHFGQHAHGKTVPAWVLTMPVAWRTALLEGYVSADGSAGPRYTSATTASKRLAIGMRLLAESLGYRVSLGSHKQHSNVIEGRTVHVRDQWGLRWSNNKSSREAFDDGQHAWLLVKEIIPGRDHTEVFNLSVAEDESYVADGIVVHNCTAYSRSKGKKRANLHEGGDLWGKKPLTPEEERSRVRMFDPVYWAEYHRYDFIIIENVVDVRLWSLWNSWLQAWTDLGYEFRVLYWNSMFFHPTPQSRDRLYVVLWKKGMPAPDLDWRPDGWCAHCERRVASVQSWKDASKPWGKYGKRNQYVYRCPTCAREVVPDYYAAWNCIDWSLPTVRIGERAEHKLKPLVERTRRRIALGLEKFRDAPWPAFLVNFVHSGHDRSKTSSVLGPMPTQISHRVHGVCVPPFLVSQAHTGGHDHRAYAATEALPTQTGTRSLGLVTPPFLLSVNHSDDRVRSLDQPMPTAMPRTRPALVLPPFLCPYNGEPTSHGMEEALATVTTTDRHGLVVPPPFLLSYYGGRDALASLDEALPTVPTANRHAVIQSGASVTVDECGYRMLRPEEIKRAMAFDDDYVLLGNQDDQIRMLGNAVTPPPMERMVAACLEVYGRMGRS